MMKILDSVWLIKMLKKSGKTPQERLLAVFDVLADWSDEPHIRESLMQQDSPVDAESAAHQSNYPAHLLDYLAGEAKLCGAHLPEALAQQIYFIALGALQQSLHASDSQHFAHAKLAAQALIGAQTEKERYFYKPVAYGVAATLLVSFIFSGMLYFNAKHGDALDLAITNPALLTPQEEEDGSASPKSAAEMYAKVEQMRQGDCRYVEALQIPEADKRVYMESVVGGKVPTTKKDMAVAQSYLQKINCSYTPMLMKNSVN